MRSPAMTESPFLKQTLRIGADHRGAEFGDLFVEAFTFAFYISLLAYGRTRRKPSLRYPMLGLLTTRQAERRIRP